MFSKIIISAIAAAAAANAKQGRTYGINYFWSNELAQGRMDPIISPGQLQSQHVHMVAGGNGFSVSMGDDDALKSTCSGSLVSADKSVYWFPQLYFQDPKTKKFEDVKLHELKAYYFFESTTDEIKPFPPGFRMVIGNPFARADYYKQPYTGRTNTDDKGAEVNPIRWSCGQTDPNKDVYLPRTGDMKQPRTEGAGFPNMKCPGYNAPLSSYIHFPSCADLSQPFENYANNTAWPVNHYNADGSSHEDCPSGYTHLPHLFLEIKWDSQSFDDRWTEGVDEQPYVLANGDKKGFGGHADFISGWDENALDHIIQTCNYGSHGDGIDSCPGVESVANTHPANCTVTPPVAEVVTGVLDQLPGCNPIQNGPADAVMCDCSSGSPVCNGKSSFDNAPSTASSAAASKTSAAASMAPSVAIGATAIATASSSASVTSSASATTPSKTNDSNGNGNTQVGGEDDGDEGDDDEDDNSCDVPETTTTADVKATPVPMIRRSLGQPIHHHQFLHHRRAWKA